MRQSFRIWRDQEYQAWRWECHLCWPPATGMRLTPDGWRKIVTISLPHHMQTHRCHHQWVSRNQLVIAAARRARTR